MKQTWKGEIFLKIVTSILSHTLMRNLTTLTRNLTTRNATYFMFRKKKTQTLNSSYLQYFMGKNNDIFNVNSNMFFP